MIKKFKQYNESVKSLLVGPSEEEIWNHIKNLPSNEMLVKSCKIGFLKGVKLALDNGAFVNVWGDEPLKYASENGHTDIVELLLDRGADVNVNNDEPLIYASNYGHTDTVKLLLDRGADVHAKNDQPLKLASSHDDTDTINLLKKYMNNTNESLLLEKSTLTLLGVPTNVMKHIQKDLALADDTQWEKIPHKNIINDYLRQGGKNLFLQISINSIKVIVSYPTIKGTEFFVDNYRFSDDEWGGEFKKTSRQYKSYTQTLIDVRPNSNIYKLKGDFSINTQPRRKMIRKEIQFSQFNDEFVKEFLQRFDAILKRITGQGFKNAKGEIEKKAKQIAVENKMLIKSLDNPLQGPNGLSILDEFLLQFEEEYSEYFGEPITIQELVELFSRDKVMTLLMYFIYRGKIIN